MNKPARLVHPRYAHEPPIADLNHPQSQHNGNGYYIQSGFVASKLSGNANNFRAEVMQRRPIRTPRSGSAPRCDGSCAASPVPKIEVRDQTDIDPIDGFPCTAPKSRGGSMFDRRRLLFAYGPKAAS